MTRTCIVIRNPGASASAEDIMQAFEACGIGAKVETLDGDAIGERSHSLRTVGRPVVAAGGDGTVSAVARGLADSETPLGVLPLGTLNHFARDLGIPASLEEAAALIAANHVKSIDAAEVNGHLFVNNASIGFYPLMTIDRESQQAQLGRSKRFARLVAAARTLLRFHRHRLQLAIDNKPHWADTPLLFVGNNAYRITMPGAGTRERIDGGELCVIVMRSKSAAQFALASIRTLLGIQDPETLKRMDGVCHLQVNSSRHLLNLALDGELLDLSPPLDFRVRPRALKVLAPAEGMQDPDVAARSATRWL